MSYRRKEEKAMERIIRGLMKLPENRICMNCEHLGPRYVCTSFSTFVCTVCSGVHREFGHRVKSVLVATFTYEEVIALQAGGNERARQIYLQAWDPARNTQPNGSDIDRIRDFIKHVYVDKRFARERRIEKLDDKDNFYRRGLSSREDFYERRYHERSNPSYKSDKSYNNGKDYSKYFEGNSPHSIYERFGSHRSRSAARFEIVDNRIRDDRYGRRRSESFKISKTDNSMSPEPQRREEKADPVAPDPQRREEKAEAMAPELERREEKAKPMAPEPQTIRKKTNPPVLRPLKDIMREISQTNKASNATKTNKAKDADGPANHQKTAVSDRLDSADVKKDEAASASGLIDSKNNLESPDTCAKTQIESGSSIQSSKMQKTSTPPSVNSVEFLLSELSFAPGGNASENPNTNADSPTTPSTSPTAPNTSSTTPVASLTEPVLLSTTPVTSSSVATATESASTPKKLATRFAEIAAASSAVGNAQTHPFSSTNAVSRVAEEKNVQSTARREGSSLTTTRQHQPSGSPAENNSSTPFSSADSVSRVAEEKKVETKRQHEPFASPAENNSSTGPQRMPTFDALFDEPCGSLPEQTAEEAPGNASAEQSSEAQSTISAGNGSRCSERKELPAELFTFSYPTYPAPTFYPPGGMGYGMQYAPWANVAAFPSCAKSRNPFDIEDDPRPAQAAMLPSITSVPGAVGGGGMQPRPSPYASGLPQQSPSYGMYNMPTGGGGGGYMGQQLSNNTTSQRLQATGSFGTASTFASFTPPPHHNNPASFSSTSNSFPAGGGNPFA